MAFARKIWKLLVAIKDGLVLLFMLLFFMALYAALTLRPSAGMVQEGALFISLDGAVVEEPTVPDPIEQVLAASAPLAEYRARDVVRALRGAAEDDRIGAVVLDLSNFLGGGTVHMQEIGAALDEVRAAEKPVLVYATAYLDDGLMLAAHASESWVDPMGGAFVTGPGGSALYFGRLLDKLKITAHVFRVGTYKSAVEPFTRSGPSPESRDALEAVYGALWEDWKADVAKARPNADIERVTSDPVGWLKASDGDAAQAAKAAGLIDRIGSRTAFGERVAEIVGENPSDPAPGSFAHTSYFAWLDNLKEDKRGDAIGVVTVAGEIVDGKAGPGVAGGDRIAGLLNDALEEDFSALVVRVDSPGGSILASEQIRLAIERFKQRDIPVVVSMSNLAASGGYWVSTPAARIFADPGTITGSIGVFAIVPTFERTLADLGVNAAGVKTTPLSGQPDIVGGLAPEISPMIQASVENAYDEFTALVAKSRGKTKEQIDEVGQGRIWDGTTARRLGLVDEFGGLDEALAFAAKAAGIEGDAWHPVYLGKDAGGFAALLQRLQRKEDAAFGTAGRDWAKIAADNQMAVLGRALAEVERIVGAPGIRAYCLECPVQGGVSASSVREGGLYGLIARVLGQ